MPELLSVPASKTGRAREYHAHLGVIAPDVAQLPQEEAAGEGGLTRAERKATAARRRAALAEDISGALFEERSPP